MFFNLVLLPLLLPLLLPFLSVGCSVPTVIHYSRAARLQILRERCRPTPPTVFGCVPAEDDPRIALLYNSPQRRQHWSVVTSHAAALFASRRLSSLAPHLWLTSFSLTHTLSDDDSRTSHNTSRRSTLPTWLDAPLCRALLRDEGPDLAALQPVPPMEVLAAVRSKQGWPSSPYVKTMAWGLAHWTTTGQMPVLGQAQPLLGELEGAAPPPALSHAGRLDEARRRLSSALAKGGVDVEPAVCDALHVGGSPRFILNLLGLRSTTGSLQDLLPPSLR